MYQSLHKAFFDIGKIAADCKMRMFVDVVPEGFELFFTNRSTTKTSKIVSVRRLVSLAEVEVNGVDVITVEGMRGIREMEMLRRRYEVKSDDANKQAIV